MCLGAKNKNKVRKTRALSSLQIKREIQWHVKSTHDYKGKRATLCTRQRLRSLCATKQNMQIESIFVCTVCSVSVMKKP